MDDQTKKIIIAIVATAIGAFVIAWLFFGKGEDMSKDTTSDDEIGTTRISGELTFDALTPEKGDDGAITFSIRKHNTGDVFAPAKMAIVPSFDNGGTWMIEGVEKGVSYDVQATLVINGNEITKSQIATVTAPADDVDLVLTVTWKDLPEQSIKDSKNKTIAGTLAISGYIPEGATYSIFTAPARDESDLGADEVDDPKFTRVISNQKASINNSWQWDEALSKVEYRVRAELYTSAGDYIGTSNIISAEAPQHNIALSLQSKANTEPTQTPISGSVTINGSYKSDTKVVVQVREGGEGGFYEVDSFPAESNRKWAYTNAKSGVQYDVRAILERSGEELAKSNQKHTVAPAENITLTIDTDLTLEDPDTRPEVVKCEDKDDKKYDVTLRFPGIADARSYWVKVGKEKHGGDRFNEPERPDSHGGPLEVKIRIDESKYYYTEYAYSYCKDCTTLDSYSDFSPSLKFYCGDDPDDD
jgi:hypothetical protein